LYFLPEPQGQGSLRPPTRGPFLELQDAGPKLRLSSKREGQPVSKSDLLERIRTVKASLVTYDDLCSGIRKAGFRFVRTSEGYMMFEHPRMPWAIAVQARDEKVESRQAYRVRMLEQYDIAAAD
jgi:hypothetical protein